MSCFVAWIFEAIQKSELDKVRCIPIELDKLYQNNEAKKQTRACVFVTYLEIGGVYFFLSTVDRPVSLSVLISQLKKGVDRLERLLGLLVIYFMDSVVPQM
ncbi:hypothetical protein O6H91_01G158200 [Diphasiastrum complanatum]|uniref:Uncharacterized protein n=1 Tax=Diphasiastrum complanatum TaxID=34168 RepID=A0ACC2EYA3_DIPCM|nr:hypothetical protein O6H91_Y512400 [Diphasiastrum complanatum]KAJ7571295.1 hypothetical protein O6H91_01G158200 [Diphasiastrum complanatum]